MGRKRNVDSDNLYMTWLNNIYVAVRNGASYSPRLIRECRPIGAGNYKATLFAENYDAVYAPTMEDVYKVKAAITKHNVTLRKAKNVEIDALDKGTTLQPISEEDRKLLELFNMFHQIKRVRYEGGTFLEAWPLNFSKEQAEKLNQYSTDWAFLYDEGTYTLRIKL